MKNQFSFLMASPGAGKSADGRGGVHASTSRRELDAPTSKMFANIHRNKERFSVAAVSKAFANVRTIKPR
jgi:hypothetical protein